MWTILGFAFAVAIFFFGYAIGWAHGRDDLLEQQEYWDEDDDDD